MPWSEVYQVTCASRTSRKFVALRCHRFRDRETAAFRPCSAIEDAFRRSVDLCGRQFPDEVLVRDFLGVLLLPCADLLEHLFLRQSNDYR